MRLLVAAGLYPPEIGGPATYAKLLEEHLPGKGVSVTVLPFRKVRGLPRLVRHAAYAFLLVFHLLRSDRLLALDPVSVGFPAACACWLLRKPFFVRVAGDYAWEQWQQRSENSESKKRGTGDTFVSPEVFQQRKFDWFTEWQRKVERYVARKARRIIVPSRYLKSIVARWGIDDKKITVIYNGLDSLPREEDKNSLRLALGLNGKILVSAGRLVPWKGFRELIEALPAVLEHYPDTKLYIAGDGPDLLNLQFTTENLQLKQHVVFLGRLPQKKLFEYIRAAHVFVLNTGYEGFSHQIIETMALGTPVVTTAVGGNPEIIEDGLTGVLVPRADKGRLVEGILKLLHNENYKKRVIMAAQVKVAEFTHERTVRETASFLAA